MTRFRMGLALGLLCATGAAGAQGTPRIPNLWLVGDGPGMQETAAGFNPKQIHVQLSTAAGETPRAYLHSGAWDALLTQMQAGDYVILDFSATTATPQDAGDATRTLAGFGDGTFDYLDPGTHKLELVHSYGWYLRRMVVDVVNHGGAPLLCAGPPEPQKPGAGDWARAIAMEQRVPLVPVQPDGSGVVPGLQGLQPDPLAPYLAKGGAGGS